MRESGELATALTDVREERAYSPEPAYYDGCVAALEWVIRGNAGQPPISHRHAPISAEGELGRAVAMLHGEEQPSRPRAYLSGVECTLAWALGQTDEPPL